MQSINQLRISRPFKQSTYLSGLSCTEDRSKKTDSVQEFFNTMTPESLHTIKSGTIDVQDHDKSSADDDDIVNHEYSIGDEVSLKTFINIINEKDRGLPPEKFFDPGAMIEQLVGKTFDTVEDASLMFRRNFAEYSNDANALSDWYDEKNQSHKPRVLVVGSGWASHAFIKCIDTELFRVLVVSPTNYFVFTPMLASSSVGTTEVRSIVESIRESNPTVKFLEGKGLDINTEERTMKVELGEGDIVPNDAIADAVEKEIIDIPYDVAIYAPGVGPISSSRRIPGLSPLNVHFLKTINDARRLRSAVIDLLEKASQPNLSEEQRRNLLTFVITGGGPTGVELTGELTDFLNDVTGNKASRSSRQSVAPFKSLAKYVKIKLIQGSKDLLPMFDENLRGSAKVALEKAGVEVMTSTRVEEIQSKEMIVVKNDKGEVQSIPCGVIVWAAGTKPVQLTEKLIRNLDEAALQKLPNSDTNNVVMPSSLSERGRIPVDGWMRVLGAHPGSMLAIGDAAGSAVGETLPQTAQVAAQQGAYVARLLNRGYDLSGNITGMAMGSVTEQEDGNGVMDELHHHHTSEQYENDSSSSSMSSFTITTHHHTTPAMQTTTTKQKSLLFLPPPIHPEARNPDNHQIKFKLRGQIEAKPFNFLNLGQLAYTGGGEALSQVELGNKKLFSRAGSVGYLLWKSVYLVKQVSTKSRVLVLFDWAKTKIFGRDVTRM